MEAVRDLLKAVRSQLSERLGNPLVGAFLIAWPAINIRALIVLFSDGPGGYERKLWYIDNFVYPTAVTAVLKCFAAPSAVALAYLLLHPFLLRCVMRYHKSQEHRTSAMLLRLEGRAPIPQDKLDEIQRAATLAEERAAGLEQQLADSKDTVSNWSHSAEQERQAHLASVAKWEWEVWARSHPEYQRHKYGRITGGNWQTFEDIAEHLLLDEVAARYLAKHGLTTSEYALLRRLAQDGDLDTRQAAQLPAAPEWGGFNVVNRLVSLGLADFLCRGNADYIRATNSGVNLVNWRQNGVPIPA